MQRFVSLSVAFVALCLSDEFQRNAVPAPNSKPAVTTDETVEATLDPGDKEGSYRGPIDPNAVPAENAGDKKEQALVDKDTVEYILQFRFKNDEPDINKARLDIAKAIDPERGNEVIAKLDKEYAGRLGKNPLRKTPAEKAISDAYHAALAKAVLDGEVSSFAFRSDAAKSVVFDTILQDLKKRYGTEGPIQERFMEQINSYARQMFDRKVRPSIELLAQVSAILSFSTAWNQRTWSMALGL